MSLAEELITSNVVWQVKDRELDKPSAGLKQRLECYRRTGKDFPILPLPQSDATADDLKELYKSTLDENFNIAS